MSPFSTSTQNQSSDKAACPAFLALLCSPRRIPLSAHVCTLADAPAAARAGIYLVEAVDGHDKAQLLLQKYRTLKDSDYRDALWSGYWALKRTAENHFAQVVQRGALLHYGNSKATTLGEAVSSTSVFSVERSK